MVFLGHDPKGIKCDDIAANPEVHSPSCYKHSATQRSCRFDQNPILPSSGWAS